MKAMSIVCAACGRRQDLAGPKALTPEECMMIGWARDDSNGIWLCPLDAPGGKAKLEAVAKKGLSGS